MPLPEPEVGLVISFSYLWRREQATGNTEGRKTRPCVIVLAIEDRDKSKWVTVAPVTHTKPTDCLDAIEIPLKVKKHLGLDDRKSWVIVAEVNQFIWPGYDLRPVFGSKSRYHYGFIPPRLFQVIKTSLINRFLERRVASTKRD